MNMSFVKVYVNSTPVRVAFNTSFIGAIACSSISLPRFCYHDKLNIAGNCRICLIEIEKAPKPQAACALPVTYGIKAFTSTPMVKKAREAVLEFLLVNHPLDCPICDQGGCCDLQDQAIKFGSKLSRFMGRKRGVEDKIFGFLIKSVITRCIHCTRCLRFASFAAGVEDLGTSLRGNHTEIGTYVYKFFDSEVSSNVIDLCPVGRISPSKRYSFRYHRLKLHTFHIRWWSKLRALGDIIVKVKHHLFYDIEYARVCEAGLPEKFSSGHR